MGYLRIGELSAQTGTNNETLRFYENKGLISNPRRSDAGYRLYTRDDVNTVKFIVRAKRMGFSLKEIAELLAMQVDKEGSTCSEVKELATAKLVDINGKIEELMRMKKALLEITDACCGGDEPAVDCTILHALEAAP